jgi:hypothetical protein
MRVTKFQDPFVRVLNHLENTLTASHIAAFPVLCWSPADDVVKVREEISQDSLDFSHVPIRDGNGHVRWIAYREDLNEKHGPLKKHARPLEERHVVDASRPLRDILLLLQEHGVLLVRSPESGQPDGISGIINHADIQKTPVRMLLFAQITEIEARLRNQVSCKCRKDHFNWEEKPNCGEYKNSAERKRHDPEGRLPLINYLNPRELMLLTNALDIPLRQKLSEVKTPKLPKCEIKELSEDEFEELAKELKELRNAIAHGNDIGCPCGAKPLDSIDAVNSAFDLVGNILKAVMCLDQTDGSALPRKSCPVRS